MVTTAGGRKNGRTVQAHRTQAVIQTDGTLRLSDLPFVAGAEVEVVVLEGTPSAPAGEGSLHHTVLKDVDPFGPATPPDAWDAAR